MTTLNPDLIPFLLRAKQHTYAAGTGSVASSRPASHDLAYNEGPWGYIDTYLGGYAFSGEEAVWLDGTPLWSMNYYGTMTVKAEDIPDGFFDVLKRALLLVPAEAPYRGPAQYDEGRYSYRCHSEGSPAMYRGEETIACDGEVIYILYFHGGQVVA